LSSLGSSITSRSIIEKVAKKLVLNENVKSPAQIDATIESIKKNMTVTVKPSRDNGPDFFTVSYKGSDPVKVRDMVNTFVQEYINESLSFKKTDVSSAHEFIQGQLAEYKAKLDESDKAIREFREANPDMVPQSETSLISRIENYQSTRIEADIRLKELIRKRESLQKQLSGEKELTVSVVTSEGSPQGRLNYLNNQLVLLRTKFTDSHPELIKIKSEIEELKKQIAQAKTSQIQGAGYETSTTNPVYQQLREELVRTDAEMESLRARIAEISRKQHEGERVLGKMPKEQEEWAKMVRDRNVYQKIHDELLLKLETAKVSKDLEDKNKGGSFKIVDAAITPRFPIQPNRVNMILIGLFAGIAAGIGVVIGLDYLSNSFENASSVESKLKLTVLATIPKITTEADKQIAAKIDKKVFTAAGAYLAIICLVLLGELIYRYTGISIADLWRQ
jgi:polysaccharide chain length determinant protein (PEP-CTERM system associated)